MQQHSTALMIFFIIILVFNKFFYKKKIITRQKLFLPAKAIFVGQLLPWYYIEKKLHTVYLKLYKPPL